MYREQIQNKLILQDIPRVGGTRSAVVL